MSEGGRQCIGSKVWIRATLQTSSEGGRQRFGSKVNSEPLRRDPVLEKETRNEEYLRFYSFRFIGPPGGDSNLVWKMIDDFQRGRGNGLSLCMSVEMRRLTSLVSLKETCSDFLLDILKNPPGGDSRLDIEDMIGDF